MDLKQFYLNRVSSDQSSMVVLIDAEMTLIDLATKTSRWSCSKASPNAQSR